MGAARKLFSERGYMATSTSLIAERAKVSNGTLFNIFPTKKEIGVAVYREVLAVRDDAIRSALAISPDDVERTIGAVVTAIAQFVVTNPTDAVLLQDLEAVRRAERWCDASLQTARQGHIDILDGWARPRMVTGRVRLMPASIFAAFLLRPVGMELPDPSLGAKAPDSLDAVTLETLVSATWAAVAPPVAVSTPSPQPRRAATRRSRQEAQSEMF